MTLEGSVRVERKGVEGDPVVITDMWLSRQQGGHRNIKH
jgi:hypothetical protein